MTTSTSTLPSIVRTLTPIAAGWLIALALRLGVHLSSGAALGIVIPVISGAWYVAVRLLERHVPAAGWLLGWAAAPTYPADTTTAPTTTSAPTPS